MSFNATNTHLHAAKSVALFVIFVASAVYAVGGHAIAQGQPEPGEIVPGELLIKLAPGTSVEAALGGAGLSEAANLTPVEELSDRLGIWRVTFDDTVVPAEAALTAVSLSPGVAVAQFNHYVELRGTIPNDDEFGQQWALRNTGQTGGSYDADIDAPEAWDIETGGLTTAGDRVVVAVIDGGFDLGHSDLDFWKNPGEPPGNGVDDDGNGYVDDYDGWDAYNDDGSLPGGRHGTHVSGIAAAEGNNSDGIAGVVWDAEVMPVAGSSNIESVVIDSNLHYQIRFEDVALK